MSVEEREGLDGVVIVAAGKSPREQRPLDFKKSSLSVLVCTGETDSNYPFSQMAESFYREGGLQDYCYEEWLTQGHVSHISERVVEWLNVQAKKEESPEALQSYCDKIVRDRLAENETRTDPKARYISLRHNLKSPAASYIQDSLHKTLLAQGRELSKDPSVVAWLESYKTFRKIVEADQKVYGKGTVTSAQAKKIKEHYLKLIKTSQESDLKIRAAYGYMRKSKDEAMLLLQERDKAAPDYQKFEKELKEMRDVLNRQRPPDPQLVAEFQRRATELGTLNNEIAMSSFRKIEWDPQFSVDDPLVNELIEEGRRSLEGVSPYSGTYY